MENYSLRPVSALSVKVIQDPTVPFSADSTVPFLEVKDSGL